MYNDFDIIKGIRKQDKNIIESIYNKYSVEIKRYIVKNSGTISEAEDILQDTIIIVFKSLKKNDFKLTSTFDAYFSNIYQNIWKCTSKQKKMQICMESFPEDSVLIDNEIIIKYNREQLHKIITEKFRVLEKDCKQVLQMFYLYNRSMKEIAFSLEYKNEQIAKNKRYRCLGYLKTLIKSHDKYKSFTENE